MPVAPGSQNAEEGTPEVRTQSPCSPSGEALRTDWVRADKERPGFLEVLEAPESHRLEVLLAHLALLVLPVHLLGSRPRDLRREYPEDAEVADAEAAERVPIPDLAKAE